MMFYYSPQGSFRILNIFRVVRAKRDKISTGRTHTVLSYRLRGSAVFETEESSLRADTGSIVFIPEGVDFRNRNEGEEELIAIHLEAYGKIEQKLQVETDMEELEPLFTEILQTWERGDSSTYNRSMSQLYRIFEEIRHRKEHEKSSIPTVIASGVKRLQREYRDPELSIKDLAADCFISEVYFRRVYKEYFKESPLQTITDLRFEYACQLLKSGYYSIKQVAKLSGFGEVKYFRVAFKKRFGQTPTEFITKNHI